MVWSYGDFSYICQRAAIPACNVVFLAPQRTCELKGIQVQSTLTLTNLGDSIVALLAIILTIIVMVKTFRKYAAVGRKELNVLNAFYIITLAVQIVTCGGFINSVGGNRMYLQVQLFSRRAGSQWLLSKCNLNTVRLCGAHRRGTPLSGTSGWPTAGRPPWA
jgi:hypothetical protein